MARSGEIPAPDARQSPVSGQGSLSPVKPKRSPVIARLRRAADVSLIPEENQKTLTDEERAAAVVVGNQQNHLLSIEP